MNSTAPESQAAAAADLATPATDAVANSHTAAPDAPVAVGGEQRPPRQPKGERGGRGQRGGRGNGPAGPAKAGARGGAAPARQHPVLDQLALLYPALFGETLLPLKRGIFQDLLEAQPEALDKDGLKAALALHTRSSRYLTAVASGLPRHNLAAEPVEALAPEHVHHALIEVFRRRGARSAIDLRPKLRQRIAVAFEAANLSLDAYLELVSGKDEEVNQITRDAVEEVAGRLAKDEALLRAFEASGKNLNEFADMYGLHVLDANRTLDRAKVRREQLVANALAETTPSEARADTIQSDDQDPR